MQIRQIPQIALLCAVAFIAGCHKNAPNAENPPAGTPASTQPANPDQTSQAPTSGAPASTATNPAPAQPTGSNPSAASSTTPAPAAPAVTPTPNQPVAPQEAANAPAPAPAPLPEVPAGTILSIRMNQTINVKHAEAGQPFTGTIVNPIVVDGDTVIPSGAAAEGMVVSAHKRGHFKGQSVLQLTLTGLNVHGQHYRIDTSSLTRTKKGKGKRSAAFIGGGTGLGMLIGGVATGGVGLLVGGLAGAGAGTGVAAFTGNKDITIPAESVVNFKLAQPIHLR
jgi:hypothetical protein